jgi:hypothetical protein
MLRAVSQKADVDPFAKLIHDLCVAAGGTQGDYECEGRGPDFQLQAESDCP